VIHVIYTNKNFKTPFLFILQQLIKYIDSTLQHWLLGGCVFEKLVQLVLVVVDLDFLE
jgi:hypothetical protein